MRSSFAFFALLIVSFYLVFGGSPSVRNSSAHDFAEQSAFDKREAAYRANNLGVALLEQYNAKEATEAFTRALELKPDLLIARINLSIALYYLPDAEGAKREAQKALTQDENVPQPHYLLGLIARSQNRFDEAIAELQKVLKGDPDDVGANINVGQILVQQKRYEQAIGAFRRAIDAEPYNETALYNLGLLLTRTGKRDEGQRLIQKFQQLKQSGAGTALGTNYLESGHYAEAVVSTGAERDLVDRVTLDAKFVEGNRVDLPSVANKTEVFGRVFRQSDFENLVKSEAGRRDLFASLSGSVLLFDYDGDGALDLFVVTPTDQRLYRNEGSRFVEVTQDSGALAETVKGVGIGAVSGDYDNDGRPDLFVFRFGSLSLYHNDGKGKFSNVTTASGIPAYPFLTCSVAFVDVDHDGDLDIFIAGLADLSKPPPGGEVKVLVFPSSLAGAPNMLLRNNGNSRFTDITAAAKVGSVGHAVAVVPTDFDNRRDVDLLVVNYDTAPDLFSNQRDGSFRNVARAVGLDTPPGWNCVAVAAGDVNKDGFTDLFIGRAIGSGLWVMSDGKRHFKMVAAPSGIDGSSAAQFMDYDNDGLLDLVTVSARGLRVSRNLGDGWMDVTDQAVARELREGGDGHDGALGQRLAASGDLDGDGDTDLILRGPGWVRILRNDGGNRNQSVRVNLKGRVSNRSAIEAKVEMRAGSLWQKLETYSASPAPAPADLIFGLGRREAPDAVRVLWPAGIVQAETEFPASAGGRLKLDITELDRKPSSCPYLYAWNGERFEFVTDFMGGGEMGYLEEPGRYNRPDPEEYVRIRGDQLKEKDGRYELRVTNELEEAMFVDRLQLLVVTHPGDAQVYPNEGMSEPPKPFKLFVTQNARPPLAAIDHHGKDVLDLVSRLDRRWPDDFKVGRIRGYAEEHALMLRLPDAGSADVSSATARRSLAKDNNKAVRERRDLSAHRDARAAKTTKESKPERTVLLLTGWTDYAWSSDNVAASQAGKAMKPPVLQVKDAKGNWRTVVDDIGIPVGRPQTVTVDLTNKFLSGNREVRIVTNMRIYWDQILFDTSGGNSPAQIARLDPGRAELKWRGFSAEGSPDNREPFGYDYARVSFMSPWKVMTGRYTREGDVRELLLRTDDMFAICRPGDEISLSFDAGALPPLPGGWTRTFLLYSDGFSKEMDINSASPDQVAPLPFHGMSRYPYAWPEHYPLTEARQRYIEKYNTRVVRSPVPSIESFIVQR